MLAVRAYTCCIVPHPETQKKDTMPYSGNTQLHPNMAVQCSLELVHHVLTESHLHEVH